MHESLDCYWAPAFELRDVIRFVPSFTKTPERCQLAIYPITWLARHHRHDRLRRLEGLGFNARRYAVAVP